MLIKKPPRHPILSYILNYIKYKKGIFVLIIILLIGYAASLLVIARIIQNNNVYAGYLKQSVIYKTHTIGNYIKGRFSRPEQLSIDIKFLNFNKIEKKRKIALELGVLITNSDDYVPASIQYQGKRYKVKLRLKGDWTDHLIGDKWSFRIKISGNQTIMGMNKFSLQHPRTRGYIHEWLYHTLLHNEGVLSLKYEFISLRLNGKNLGIYALEEHFDKRLLERQGMKEGPIVKFSEDMLWLKRVVAPIRDGTRLIIGGYDTYPDGFQLNKTIKDPLLKKQFLNAYQLLDLFRRGEIDASDAFDVQSLAAHFAVSDVMGAPHGSIRQNMRYYYNPILSKLMPIGFDGDPGELIEQVWLEKRPPHSNYLRDLKFIKAYVAYLVKLSSRNYFDSFLTEIDKELSRNRNILYKDFPAMAFKLTNIYTNQILIRNLLNPPKPLYCYLQHHSSNHLVLSIGNNQIFPIEILGIYLQDRSIGVLSENIIIRGRKGNQFTSYKEHAFDLLKHSQKEISNIKLSYRLLGDSTLRKSSVFPYSRIENNFVRQDYIRAPSTTDQFSFIIQDDVSKKITFKSGHWVLDKPLILPENYLVKAHPGLILDIKKDAMIFSKSPLEFVGTAEKPITIRSSGPSAQGVAVLNARKESILKHVYFKGLSNPTHQMWDLTGAVTFYQSPVTIDHCVFSDNKSEDALNIIRSSFLLKNSHFENAYSDVIDIDFSSGSMQDITIYQAGNDGIDVSGSQVELKDIQIDGAGDKAISAGEDSHIIGRNIVIKNSEIALASKDNSSINADTIHISSANVGFVVFQKKPEYGPGSMDLKQVRWDHINTLSLVENKSFLMLNGVEYIPNTKNLKNILYGKIYGKETK